MSFLERVLEDPKRRRRLKQGACLWLAAAVLAEAVLRRVFPGGESHFRFEDIPGWGSIYGLGSCVAIIVVSKAIGKLWLMRGEDYYDR